MQDDQADDDGPTADPAELLASLTQYYAEQLGHSPPTRRRASMKAVGRFGEPVRGTSESRRDGFRPAASEHLRRYLLHTVMGVSARELGQRDGLSPSAVYSSIAVGGRLARANARRLGLVLPRRPAAAEDEADDDTSGLDD